MSFLHVFMPWRRGAKHRKGSLQSSLALWAPCKQAGEQKQRLSKMPEMPHALTSPPTSLQP